MAANKIEIVQCDAADLEYCPFCGRKLEWNEKVCKGCGESLLNPVKITFSCKEENAGKLIREINGWLRENRVAIVKQSFKMQSDIASDGSGYVSGVTLVYKDKPVNEKYGFDVITVPGGIEEQEKRAESIRNYLRSKPEAAYSGDGFVYTADAAGEGQNTFVGILYEKENIFDLDEETEKKIWEHEPLAERDLVRIQEASALMDEEKFAEAMEVFQKYAFSNGGCAYMLGWMYRNGVGTAQDDKKAVYWYRVSSALGEERGMNALGICLFNGEGAEADRAKAFRTVQYSAVLGNAEGMYLLGCCYYADRGRKKTLENRAHAVEKAEFWLTKAKEAGYERAEEKLKEIKQNEAEVVRELEAKRQERQERRAKRYKRLGEFLDK